MKPLIYILFCLLSFQVFAQEPVWIQFENNEPFGGGGYIIENDQFNNLYILTAWSHPGFWNKGSSIIKYNSDGEKQWIYSRQVDTAGVMGMALNEYGNCFVILNNRPWTPFAGIYGVDQDGNELYFNLENDVNYHGITCDSSGNAYITGYKYLSTTNFDLIVAKYNIAGIKEWESNWTLPSNNAFGNKIFLLDQILYVYGHTHHSNILLKFDLQGQLLDYTTFFEDPWYEFLYRSQSDIKSDSDKNILVTGYNQIESGNIKYGFIYKFDTALNKIWSDTLSLMEDAMRDISFDGYNNVILSGYNYDEHIASYAKYSKEGVKLWHYKYDSCISSGFSDVVSSNDKIYFTGSTYYQGTPGHRYLLYVTNQDGEYISQHYYTGSDSSHSGGSDMLLDDFGNLFCIGSYDDTGDVCMTIKYDAITFEEEIFANNHIGNIRVYPNPAKTLLNIDLSNTDANPTDILIYTLDGKKVKEVSIMEPESGNYIQIDLSGISAGIYFLSVQYPDKVISKKVVITD